MGPQNKKPLFAAFFVLSHPGREVCPDNPEYFRETSGSPGGPTGTKPLSEDLTEGGLFIFIQLAYNFV